MAVTTVEHPDKTLSKDWQADFMYFKQRAYRAGQESDLASMDLEEGDELPSDSTYQIVSSRIEYHRDGGRVAIVTAFLEKYY